MSTITNTLLIIVFGTVTSRFPKRVGSYTSLFLSEHLFLSRMTVARFPEENLNFLAFHVVEVSNKKY